MALGVREVAVPGAPLGNSGWQLTPAGHLLSWGRQEPYPLLRLQLLGLAHRNPILHTLLSGFPTRDGWTKWWLRVQELMSPGTGSGNCLSLKARAYTLAFVLWLVVVVGQQEPLRWQGCHGCVCV